MYEIKREQKKLEDNSLGVLRGSGQTSLILSKKQILRTLKTTKSWKKEKAPAFHKHSRLGLLEHTSMLEDWTWFLYFVLRQQVLVTLVACCLFLDSRQFRQLLFNGIAYWQFVYTKIFSSELMQFYCSPVLEVESTSRQCWLFFCFVLLFLATQFRESLDIFHGIFPDTFFLP